MEFATPQIIFIVIAFRFFQSIIINTEEELVITNILPIIAVPFAYSFIFALY